MFETFVTLVKLCIAWCKMNASNVFVSWLDRERACHHVVIWRVHTNRVFMSLFLTLYLY